MVYVLFPRYTSCVSVGQLSTLSEPQQDCWEITRKPPTPSLFPGFVIVPLPLLAAHGSLGALWKTLGKFLELTFSLDPQMTNKKALSLFSSSRTWSGGFEIC